MGMVRALRLADDLIEGRVNGSQLETKLNSGMLGDWKRLARLPSVARRLAGNAAAFATISASPTALQHFAAASVATLVLSMSSPQAVTNVRNNAETMTLAAASREAMDALFSRQDSTAAAIESGVARLAIWSSDTALAALKAGSNGRAAMRAHPSFSVLTLAGTTTAAPIPGFTGRRIVFGIGASNVAYPIEVTPTRGGGMFTFAAADLSADTASAPAPAGVAGEAGLTARLAPGWGSVTGTLAFATLPV